MNNELFSRLKDLAQKENRTRSPSITRFLRKPKR